MKIITFSNQKGGVGKTTLAINLATALQDIASVAIYDSDHQKSLENSQRTLGKNNIKILSDSEFDSIITKKKSGIDFLIIDTPPYLTSKLETIFKVSNLIIVPTKAGYLDLLASKDVISLISKAGKANSTYFLLNMVNKSSKLPQEAMDFLEGSQCKLLKQSIADRQSFIRSVITPDGIFGTEDKKAALEVNNLTKEILAKLNN